MKIKEFWERFHDWFFGFLQEIGEWLKFLSIYGNKKATFFVTRFEKTKDALVDLLLVKRGRYSKQFLNISFLFLVAGAIIVSPVIADYYPSVIGVKSYEESVGGVDLSYTSLGDTTTTTAESDKPRFEIIDYEVGKGDTLSTVADKFNISVDTIKWANSLKTEKLVVGQTLRIPPVTGIVHKVGAGDTIYSIAKKYKSDPQKVVNFPANDFADLETFALNIGQVIFVPDGVMPEAAPIYKPAPVPQYIASGGGMFLWPTQGIITQYPVSYHMALDIANAGAPPVAAAESGVIAYSGCLNWGYGCHIIINHDNGYQSLYGHLQALYAKAGDRVARGQVIGRMGSTGRSTGTHTHFEIRKNGVLLNPLSFLK